MRYSVMWVAGEQIAGDGIDGKLTILGRDYRLD